MRRAQVIPLFILLVFMLATNVSVARAYPPCDDQQPPNDPQAFCIPPFSEQTIVRIRSSKAFVWLRSAPSANAEIVATVYPRTYGNLQIIHAPTLPIPEGGTSGWDGNQWWWYVRVYPGSASGPVQGWVEQAAIVTWEHAPGLAAWRTPTLARIRPRLTPVAVYANPSVRYGSVVATLPGGTAVTLLASEERYQEPAWDADSRVWLWRVQYVTPSGPQWGWVDQKALVLAQ